MKLISLIKGLLIFCLISIIATTNFVFAKTEMPKLINFSFPSKTVSVEKFLEKIQQNTNQTRTNQESNLRVLAGKKEAEILENIRIANENARQEQLAVEQANNQKTVSNQPVTQNYSNNSQKVNAGTQIQPKSVANVAKPVIPAPAPVYPNTITIPKIGLYNIGLSYGTNSNQADMDAKLYNGPVVESSLAAGLCSNSGNSYIYGHSESDSSSFLANIFSSLTALGAGDEIQVTNGAGVTCKYQVKAWESITTSANNLIKKSDLNRLMNYPANGGSPSLTLQTCQKGSSTVRLILRAVKVN